MFFCTTPALAMILPVFQGVLIDAWWQSHKDATSLIATLNFNKGEHY